MKRLGILLALAMFFAGCLGPVTPTKFSYGDRVEVDTAGTFYKNCEQPVTGVVVGETFGQAMVRFRCCIETVRYSCSDYALGEVKHFSDSRLKLIKSSS